jgi:hypothetical protein
MNANDHLHRLIFQSIPQKAMLERDLIPDLSTAACAEYKRVPAPATLTSGLICDLRGLQGASIEMDEAPDRDQLTVAQAMVLLIVLHLLAGGRVFQRYTQQCYPRAACRSA